MSRIIGVVAAQVAPRPFDLEATFAKFAREVRLLARTVPDFQLFVFPELYLTALGSFGDDYPAGWMERVAEPIPGPTTDRVGALARETGRWLAAGSLFERDGEAIYNTAIVLDPDGNLAARYRKVFPWRPYEMTTPGDTFTTFDIPGIGRFGLAICYDGWFPESMRTLAWMGAEVIIQPTYTRTVDREQELAIARANAIVNQLYIVNPNIGQLFGTGRSLIVDPEGRTMASGGSGEEFLTQLLDLDLVTATREHGTGGMVHVWKQLRDLPPPAFPPYVEGFAQGAVMNGLGPMRFTNGATTAAAADREGR